MVNATIIQFRRGRRIFKPRHFLLEVEEINNREKAKKFVGKSVSWTSPGKEPKVIKGKITSAHGNNGVLRSIFERGLPGQAIGTEAKIESSKEDK